MDVTQAVSWEEQLAWLLTPSGLGMGQSGHSGGEENLVHFSGIKSRPFHFHVQGNTFGSFIRDTSCAPVAMEI
jgi:hypothetical protein